MKDHKARFHTLDGMRGMAALVVAAYHLTLRYHDNAFPGYLAVDLFFAISGFVIALSYTEKFADGLTWLRFTELRLVRLFPLYLAGLLLGLGKDLLGHILHDPHALMFGPLTCDAAFGAVMLPSPCAQDLFPLNGPSWSLFFEIVINVLFALTLWRLRSAILLGIMVVSAIFLVSVINAPDYFNVGWGWANALQGVARTAFSFPVGILIYRLSPVLPRRTTWLALIPVVATVTLMLVKAPADLRPIAQLLVVFVAFPGLVIAAICFEAPKLLASAFGFIGDLSYPLYAIHFPLIAIAMPLTAKLHLTATAAGVAFVVVLIPAAYLASLADAQMRRRVSSRLKLRRTAPPQVVSGP